MSSRAWPFGFAAGVAIACGGCVDALTVVTVKPDGSATVVESAVVSREAETWLSVIDPESAEMFRGGVTNTFMARAAAMGEGARLREINAVTNQQATGWQAVYEIPGIAGRKIDLEPAVARMFGSLWKEGGFPAVFNFEAGKGKDRELKIDLPPVGEPRQVSPAPLAKTLSLEQLAVVRRLFHGFRAVFAVAFDGQIERTNAAYREIAEQRIILFSVDADELAREDAMLRDLLASGPIEGMAGARKALAGRRGCRVEGQTAVSVRFR